MKDNNEQQAYINLYGKHKKVLDIFMSRSGWIWFIVKQPKTTNIWEAWVKGIENEYGSVYKSDLLDSTDVFRVPKFEWVNFEEVFFK